MAFTGTVTLFKRFHVFSSLDLTNGAKKLDGNTRVRCGIFGRCKENFAIQQRSEEHTSELQSPCNLVCRLLLEKKKQNTLQLTCVPTRTDAANSRQNERNPILSSSATMKIGHSINSARHTCTPIHLVICTHAFV